ncbi:hypothetical protein [Sinomonas mesophila]|uniref:hypothetical protein n=1 Tax=Sinomonas mesophila TaxID=1531955 RepID=UPI0009847EB9|nr:hypothetical protein [Sinomonas mesophila]
MKRELVLPPDFDDYGWEVEYKGVFWGGAVRVDDRLINVIFYAPVRLQQDIAADPSAGRLFTEKHLLVVARVTLENMRWVVENAPDGFFE